MIVPKISPMCLFDTKRAAMALIALLLVTGCTTVKETNPARTATEQLLISTAADRAAANLVTQIPKGAKTFVDAAYFEGTDSKYAIGAVRGSLLQQGVVLADDKKSADVVVEIRAGALSTDQKETLVGIPSFTVPVPFASTGLTTPEIAFYKSEEQKGVAKFAANTYNAQGWALSTPQQDAQYGFSHNTKHTILVFFSWDSNDAVPKEDDVVTRSLRVTNINAGRDQP